MNNFTSSAAGAPAATPAPGSEAYLADLIQRANDPALPISGRNKIVDAIEQHHLAKAQGATAAAAQGGQGETLEGFEPPASPMAYALENGLPPGAEIADQAGLGALKSGLHQLGVPAEIAAGGFAEIAQLHAQGAFVDQAAYDRQLVACNTAMVKVHGENAAAVIRDGLAAVDAAVRAGHLTEDAADAIVASPMALSKAAEFRRFGGKRK